MLRLPASGDESASDPPAIVTVAGGARTIAYVPVDGRLAMAISQRPPDAVLQLVEPALDPVGPRMFAAVAEELAVP
ncbi:MAG: hypothetical protein IPH30_11530 [Betaproteobacteria bacterium]|nr:hypothetical protein [Betaproteobacteria bacterium]